LRDLNGIGKTYVKNIHALLYFRLHNNGERNILTARLESAKIKRRRRHQLRKVLLILDYVVECTGCLFILFIYFVGEEFLLQHILLSLGMFIYGVPIPIAYLLNETRVRNVIISKGWVEGFKSIFNSDQKIKQMERERIVSFLHPEGTKENFGSFLPIFFMKYLPKKELSELQKK
jgi:hypothetical protein